MVTIVGSLPEIRAGEWLEASGFWAVDAKHGQQFKAEVLKTVRPDTVEGIERYLGSGLIKGIGPVLAGRLVKAFGRRVFDIIDADPHNLTYVKGIGKTRQKQITEVWAEQKAIREIMVFLHGHRVSTRRAFRIFKAYGNEAIEKVRQDPYRLARDIQGIGFKTADVIAESLGIGRQSDLRARAGVEHTLQELTGEGHCGYGREELVAMAVKLLEIPDEIIRTAVEYLLQEGRVVPRTLDSDAGGQPAIFLAGLDLAEKNLAENLMARQTGKHPCPKIDLDKAIAWVEGKTGLQLAAQQRQAVELACGSKVLVITGGPGVGKTTIINSIVKIMRAKKLKVMMAAPTGRAAKRMAEATECEAKTIHRLLVFQPKTGQFK
ncbi:MAG: helix-hairpin-helix domain-containing protein, partial [Phycisphaerae bacterium]|nr:helix-hairpin-helix domain-containing protein [Phycisphaerae bacterium]